MNQTKHLQSVILMMIKDIDRFCRNNDIEYYLLGGSAIGAIRHKGFIPWDDDLDIIMTEANYRRFIKLFREKGEGEKYQLQEGMKDWPLNFSKVRLNGTRLEELEGDVYDFPNKGVYVDVFKMDNVKSKGFSGRWQYFCAKAHLCYELSVRSYKSASLKKRFLISISIPLRLKFIRSFIERQIEKYNKTETDYYGFFFGRTKFRTAITKKSIFGKPFYVNFEDTQLPVAEKYDEYLTQMFGDYMKLPPVEQRIGLHITNIDFGKY